MRLKNVIKESSSPTVLEATLESFMVKSYMEIGSVDLRNHICKSLS